MSVPQELVNMLEEWQKWAKLKTPTELVFPTKSGWPNEKLLHLQAAGERCVGSQAVGKLSVAVTFTV